MSSKDSSAECTEMKPNSKYSCKKEDDNGKDEYCTDTTATTTTANMIRNRLDAQLAHV